MTPQLRKQHDIVHSLVCFKEGKVFVMEKLCLRQDSVGAQVHII